VISEVVLNEQTKMFKHSQPCLSTSTNTLGSYEQLLPMASGGEGHFRYLAMLFKACI